VTPPSSNTLSGEVARSVRSCEDDERYCKGCIFGGKTGAIGVVLIAQFGYRCTVIVGEIFLDVGEGCSEARVAYGGDAGGRLRYKRGVGCRGSLAAEDWFSHGREVG